jgi:hypothetical protein
MSDRLKQAVDEELVRREWQRNRQNDADRIAQLEALVKELVEALFRPLHHDDCTYGAQYHNCCGVRQVQIEQARRALRKGERGGD